MRLDQFVSQAASLPRQLAQRLIRAGRVTVDATLITKASTHIDPAAAVRLDDELIQLPGELYIMLHKPAGVVSATEDPSQRTVLDVIDHPHRGLLHPVGRLDKDTTGLLLLTNDGAWSHRLTAPRHHVAKTYLAHIDKALSTTAAAALSAGVLLHGETKPVQAHDLTLVTPDQIRLTLFEGKYHQVKRMFASQGYQVRALHRERIGGLSLDPQLAAGEWRLLTATDHEALFSSDS